MAITKNSCQDMLSDYHKQKALIDKANSNYEAASEAAKSLSNKIDNLAGDTTPALLKAATTAVKLIGTGFADTISSSSAAALEAIMLPILKILLSGKDAIFSLLYLPHSQAIKYCENERRELNLAEIDFTMITNILLKWTQSKTATTPNGVEYYRAMRRAMPYIDRVINDCDALVANLEALDTEIPYFDKGLYKDLQINLKTAIDLTNAFTNSSIVNDMDTVFKRNADSIYKRRAVVIESKYAKLRDAASAEYQHNILTSNSADAPKALQLAAKKTAQLSYNVTLDKLAIEKKLELSMARLNSTVSAYLNLDNYTKGWNKILEQFAFDMKLIAIHLESLQRRLVNAYAANIASQTMSNAMYNMESLIKNLVGDVIEFLNNSQSLDTTRNTTINIINQAESLVMTVQALYQKATDDYVKQGSAAGASGISSKLSNGNAVLSLADGYLNATITDSLIGILNMQKIITDSNGAFDSFIRMLVAIPDWDGKRGTWAVANVVEGTALSPYIGLTNDMVYLIGYIPIIAFTPGPAAQKITIKMHGVARVINTLKNHNSYVLQVLNSYNPPRTNDLMNLIAGLSRLGMSMSLFAANLSLLDIVASVKNIQPDPRGMDQQKLSEYNCRKLYPGLFKSPWYQNVSTELTRTMDTPTVTAMPDHVKQIEDTVTDQMIAGQMLRTAGLSSDILPEDFLKSLPNNQSVQDPTA